MHGITFFAHPGQHKFLSSRKKYRAAVTGVGGGKSAAGAIAALEMVVANPGTDAFIVSPTYDLLHTNTKPPILKFWPPGVITNPGCMMTREGKFEARTYNNCTIYGRSADEPERLRGPNLSWAWLDEPGQMKRYAWDIILGRIRVPCPKPGIILTGTPKGLNWLYDVFVDAPPTDDYELTWWDCKHNSPNLAEGYYEGLEASYHPALARQEIGGEFVNINADAYLDVQSVVACENSKLPFMPKQEVPLYIGVDIGRRHDLTAIAVLFLRGDTFYLGKLVTLRDTPFAQQRQIINSLMPHAARCCIDRTGMGEQLAEEIVAEWGEHMVEPVTFTAPRKMQMAARLRQMFDDRTIRIPKDGELRRDLLSVQLELMPGSDTPRLVASRGEQGHADRFWALALAGRAAAILPSPDPAFS